jgi:hypothetical protein
MLHAGFDLSRRKVDVCLLSGAGEHLDQVARAPDADSLRVARRIDEVHDEPVCAVVESMTGARLVHDTLEREGWSVEIADARSRPRCRPHTRQLPRRPIPARPRPPRRQPRLARRRPLAAHRRLAHAANRPTFFDPGGDYYTRRDPERTTRRLVAHSNASATPSPSRKGPPADQRDFSSETRSTGIDAASSGPHASCPRRDPGATERSPAGRPLRPPVAQQASSSAG